MRTSLPVTDFRALPPQQQPQALIWLLFDVADLLNTLEAALTNDEETYDCDLDARRSVARLAAQMCSSYAVAIDELRNQSPA